MNICREGCGPGAERERVRAIWEEQQGLDHSRVLMSPSSSGCGPPIVHQSVSLRHVALVLRRLADPSGAAAAAARPTLRTGPAAADASLP